MTDNYEDIINLPRHVSKTHGRMPLLNRAAQFAPFAALTGHDAAIKETARLTDCQATDLAQLELLDIKFRYLQEKIESQPYISITYFRPDDRKDGGEYTTIAGRVKRISDTGAIPSVCMADGRVIPLQMVSDIQGSVFNEIADM